MSISWAGVIVQKIISKVARVLGTKMCFVAGTKVHTPDGLVNIEDLRVGDLVLARDEHDVELASDIVPRRVLQEIVTHPDELVHVSIETESGATETLVTTGPHPFYVVEIRGFVEASELKPGQTLALADDGTARITGLRQEHAENELFTTYNIEVEEAHTYFVGQTGIWVHNASGTICMRMEALYDKFTDPSGKFKLNDAQAKQKLKEMLDNSVKNKKMTPEVADKHFADATKIIDESAAAKAAAKAAAPNSVSLSASKNFNQQSHGGRAKQFLEELTGTKITEKLKTPEGTAAVLRGWEEQIQNGVLKAKGQYFDPARPNQVFEVFEGGGFTLLRSLDGALISVQRSTFDMIQRLLPKT